MATHGVLTGLGAALFLLLACHGSSKGGSAPLPPAFTLSATPPNLSIPAGGGGYVTITATRSGGFTGSVSLALEGLPTGIVAEGRVADSAQTGRLSIRVDPAVPPQSLDALRLTGSLGSWTQTTPFRLVIAAPLPTGQISPDRVQAAGGPQRAGTLENHVLAHEPTRSHDAASAPGGTEVRHGFTPNGTPNP